MALKLPDASQQAAADGVVDLLDAGAGAGKVRIYSAAQPADANIEATGLLCELPMSDPAFGAATAAGVATANAITATAASGTGTAQSFALLDSDNNIRATGTVTATGGGGDLELTSVSIVATETVTISSLTYTVPETQT